MKKLSSILFAVLLLLVSCAKDPDLATPEIPDPIPTPDSHVVPVEAALAELHAVLGDIDGQTRSGRSRSVAGVTSVHASAVLPATRTGEASDVEDLVYIANFEGGEGYAILGADDRLATVIAITEQGSLTPEEFAAVARGEYSAEGEIPPVFPDVVNYAMGLGGGIGGGGGTIGGDGGGPTITPPFTDLDTGGYPPPMPTYEAFGQWAFVSKAGPWIRVKWNQEAPYNYYKRGYYMGCVAVALGQLVATEYYKLRNTSLRFGTINGSEIDWPTIFSAISRNKITFLPTEINEDSKAVAWLLLNVGCAVFTSYGVIGSSGSSACGDIYGVQFLKTMGFERVDQYGYDPNLIFTQVNNFQNTVYVESKNAVTGNMGHAWLIDGMYKQKRLIEKRYFHNHALINSYSDYRTLFHCNFGYNGECDGYYYTWCFSPQRGAEIVDLAAGDKEDTKWGMDYTPVVRMITYAKIL